MEPSLVEMVGAIIEGKGLRSYGLSAINQRAHALQSAWLAEQAGHGATLVSACLLHDIGHMVHGLGQDPALEDVDDQHEELGHAWLARWFGPTVTEPVRLHVAAKRYLCGAEPDYFAKLGPDSVRSLTLQGGPMPPADRTRFRANPHAPAAVILRRFDDAAKVKNLVTPPFTHFMPYLAACETRGSA